jgi:hypothetical protein
MKINLAFRGGASKLPAYLRIYKEITAKGGYTGGRISGCSAGGINAAAIACQYTAEGFYKKLKQMPGERVMRWEVKAEKSKNWLTKIWYGAGVAIAAQVSLSDKLLAYFGRCFDWKMVPKGVDLYIGFALQSELAGAAGLKHGFTFYDLYKIFTTRDAKKLAESVFMYYGTRDGVYVYNKTKRRLDKISSEVIPLHKLVYSTMYNNIFESIDLRIGDSIQNPFDGGIANNHANCAQSDDFIQVCCVSKEDDGDDGTLSGYYRRLGRTPIKTVYLPPVVKGRAFFDFRDSAIDLEWRVEQTNVL